MAATSKQDSLPIALQEGAIASTKNAHKYEPEILIQVRFGERIRTLRLEHFLTQDMLANKAQVHRNYISQVEGGKRNVSLRTILQLANALGVEIQDLFP